MRSYMGIYGQFHRKVHVHKTNKMLCYLYDVKDYVKRFIHFGYIMDVTVLHRITHIYIYIWSSDITC